MSLSFAHAAMGTRFELVLDGNAESALRPVADAVFEEIQDWHDRLSLFCTSSEIAFINATAGDRCVRLSHDLYELLEFCALMYGASRGAFDITVAPLMRRLGLQIRSDDSDDPQSIGFDGVELDPHRKTIRFKRPGMAIDLGGVAKGHAIDRAGEILRGLGVECAFIHGGTSTGLAIGVPTGSEAWRVALGGCEAPAPVLSLSDQAFSVSAPHGRTVNRDGSLIGHVLDPVNGRATQLGKVCCVTGHSARVTDAWSTALVVLGSVPPGFPDDATSCLFTDGRWTIEGPGRIAADLEDICQPILEMSA